ncbi:MAG: riboflavin biosynthesis protein RibF, partial [Clostridiales bacterium]|nr:riboflavin biosynthesis protein RibF [Clostridiales bacterium]
HVVAGHDFRFCYRGEGTPERLQEVCRELGVGCDIIGRIERNGIRISSTYIRTLIQRGEMEEANAFLGHPHILSQRVAPGKHLGHTLGFPTVNLAIPPEVIVPAYGVYTARVQLEDGTRAIAVTNVGVRPTVEEHGRVNVEGYILDYDGDLYGQQVRVAFYRRLRGERKFPSAAALTDEVLRNAQQTRDYFARSGIGNDPLWES